MYMATFNAYYVQHFSNLFTCINLFHQTTQFKKQYIYIYTHTHIHTYVWTSQMAPVVKNLPTKAGDTEDAGLIPGKGRSPRGGQGNPLQYSCLENPHGQRSLMGYGPQSCKESDRPE